MGNVDFYFEMHHLQTAEVILEFVEQIMNIKCCRMIQRTVIVARGCVCIALCVFASLKRYIIIYITSMH